MSDLEDFKLVTFEKEREKVLEDLSAKPVNLAGMTDDFMSLALRVKRVEGSLLRLSFTASLRRLLKKEENIQVLFGLPEGQYLLRTKVESATESEVLVPFGMELSKLQRRNNFRVRIGQGSNVSFNLTSLNSSTDKVPVALNLLDLSAGGMRALWPAQDMSAPGVGDQISGRLSLPNSRSVEVFGTIKNFVTDDRGQHVGI